MSKFIASIISFCLVFQLHAQKQRKISANIDFHINRTLYDRTLSNNGTGFGSALQVLFNANKKFIPAFEIAGDVYGGTKMLYLTSRGEPIYAKSGVCTVVAGGMYKPSSKLYAGVMLGAGLFNDEAYFAIKPQVEYYLFNSPLIAKIAWANIFQRDHISDQSFGYLSFSLGIKLF